MKLRRRDLGDFEALGRRDAREGLPRRNVAGMCSTGQAEDYYEAGYREGQRSRYEMMGAHWRAHWK